MRIYGKGFNFSQDGPGNRLVYHLAGCNMKCIWCSNPEGLDFSAGKDYSIEEILNECKSSRMLFFSGGGVTFTGGEATMQPDELIELLKALKLEGINTCIETNGTSNRLLEIAEYTDYLIMDFKHFDNKKHKEFTRVENKQVKANFEELSKTGRQLHIRIPLINQINAEYPEKYAEYFSLHNTDNIAFEFLSYHEYGKEKWKEEYKVKNGFITKEILKSFEDAFISKGLKLIKT